MTVRAKSSPLTSYIATRQPTDVNVPLSKASNPQNLLGSSSSSVNSHIVRNPPSSLLILLTPAVAVNICVLLHCQLALSYTSNSSTEVKTVYFTSSCFLFALPASVPSV